MERFFILLREYGIFGIALGGLAEGTFLPLPMESISIPIYLVDTQKAFSYSAILIIFSIIGSIIGYYIGVFIGAPILNRIVSEERLTRLEKGYKKNSFITIFSSAFTPIPYEAYTISAGAFKIGLKNFIIPGSLSRIIRHLPQGILIYLYGEEVILLFRNYSIFIGIIALLGCLIWISFKYKEKKENKENKGN